MGVSKQPEVGRCPSAGAAPSPSGSSPVPGLDASHSVTNAQTPLSVLKAARELVADPRGYDPYRDGPDKLTGYGAVLRVMGMDGDRYPHHNPVWEAANLALCRTLGNAYPGIIYTVWGFERDYRRTHSDVLKMFDRTIARLESEASS